MSKTVIVIYAFYDISIVIKEEGDRMLLRGANLGGQSAMAEGVISPLVGIIQP